MRIIVILLFFGAALQFQAQNIKEILDASKTDVSILFFYTAWCPACFKAVQMMNEVALHYPKEVTIVGINVDDGQIRRNCLKTVQTHFASFTLTHGEAAAYGADDGVPVIYLLDREHKTVKRYLGLPNRALFLQLIDRLQQGFLENGTLPVEKRLDLWKQERN